MASEQCAGGIDYIKKRVASDHAVIRPVVIRQNQAFFRRFLIVSSNSSISDSSAIGSPSDVFGPSDRALIDIIKCRLWEHKNPHLPCYRALLQSAHQRSLCNLDAATDQESSR